MKTAREIERRILQHLHGHRSRIHLTQIHAHFLRHHLHQSNLILSHFVSVCASLRQMDYAHLLFLQTQHPNILLFNSIIKAYSLSPPSHNSLHLFSHMKKRRIWPDQFTFAPLLKSCSNLCDLNFGKTVQAQVLSLGFHCFRAVRIGLVELYVNCGKLDDANKVFDEMRERDVIVWNLMISGYCKNGNVDMGYNLFKEMGERSIVSWNTMLSCLSKSGREGEALKVFHEMCHSGFEPDEATVVTMLPVCARLGEDDVGQWIHSYAKSGKLYEKHVSVGNSLVDFYCKRGLLDAAFTVFNDMPLRNVVSWNAMISGLAFNGRVEEGLALFDEMIKKGLTPNESTFVGVLTCCVHSGLIQRGKDLFSSMVSNHQIKPKLEHYGCMVDLLGRGGSMKEAYELILSMPMKPNAALWGALLSSCHNHGDMEVAEVAVKELMILEPRNSGHYVLLSNIYAEKGKWDEVEKIRLLMMKRNINKSAGQSIIR
ncbi:putative tetratricopeptide-like helical domain superfamily [Helianthus annuus]|uniref:Tetratricopeptide-like helical domain superfamily n=2 Tax=Helianthus annuus TaxID=4232 RepID=A0A9K3JDJ4_HELAN|nr:putative tetratricopeptide-like helical domain superfamily [Helianthus annuus]KAJ0592383.1 putative tetratricopeptide-like helical domain superfamily [Helianthus annuus]KAJ0599918.1 putative tetratricopeptide-like helical domain superfamily [Helianthus annuus]KAJ0607370.1 putative tetratricopeptide-like helical domain superfamily [Helianthus annuus]KAJ0767425.1 putative tetratricopeptide-like helical domain superfamily [Helianthus annuus]